MMRRLAAVLVTLTGGCFTTDLDPTQVGAFACSEDPGGACPDGQSCVNARCEADGEVPTVQIGFPEDEQDLPLGDTAVGDRRTLEITLSGTLALTPRDGDDVFGEGHLEVTVDDEPSITVDTGSLSSIVTVPVTLDNTVGAHRISVRSVRNDGTPYDHEGGVATRLFFISDGQTPLLGIKSPWPGTEFPLEATSIEVEAAVLRFTLIPADPGGMPQPKTGHIHIYYDKDIEDCIADVDGCDKQYLTTIVQPDQLGKLTIPVAGSAGEFPLSLVLRNVDHSLFEFDPNPDDDIEVKQTFIDEVALVRR